MEAASETKPMPETSETDSSQTSTCDNKPEKSNHRIKSVSYSQTVEYRDGKRIETRKGVKRVDDDWFTLNEDGSWTPSTKDKALENSVTKTIEAKESDSLKQTCSRCRGSDLAYTPLDLILGVPTYRHYRHYRQPSVFSLLDW